MTCMDWNEEKERRMWFDEHFIGFKHFNWYLVVKFSQRCFRYRALNFGFALDIESLSYMYKNSTEISRDRRRQSQKEVVSFEISITMFPAALYISTFVTCVGRILRGWLGGGARGWAHSFLNQSLPKVTYKVRHFTKSVFDYIFSLDGFCDIRVAILPF